MDEKKQNEQWVNNKKQQQKQNKSSKIIDCFAHLFLVPTTY